MTDHCAADHEHIPPDDPRYDGFRATEAWAFLAINPADDQECAPAFIDPATGAWMSAREDQQFVTVAFEAEITFTEEEIKDDIVQAVQNEIGHSGAVILNAWVERDGS